MTIPQLKSFAGQVVGLFVLATLYGIFQANMHGELKGWSSFVPVLSDATFGGVMLTIGWILFRSPFSETVKELLKVRQQVAELPVPRPVEATLEVRTSVAQLKADVAGVEIK